ncbi:MAG: CDP-alcohol phosphatidyltransferase family protein [Bacilli bacterium]|nr:CDP-alcohol phosphatidyltransferase family protein [Bacilli bacterium]
MKSIKAYIPNAITIFRFVCNAVFVGCFLGGYMPVAITFFGVGASTDALDGYLARKWKVESKFGKYADPIADKLLGISGLALLGLTFNPLLLIPGVLEGIITLVNALRFNKKKDGDVDIRGKIKTAVLFPTILVGLFNVVYPQLTPLLVPLITATAVLQLSTTKEYISKCFKGNTKEVTYTPEVNEEELTNKEKISKVRKLINKYRDLRKTIIDNKDLNAKEKNNAPTKYKKLKYKKED